MKDILDAGRYRILADSQRRQQAEHASDTFFFSFLMLTTFLSEQIAYIKWNRFSPYLEKWSIVCRSRK